jgi:type VI secretion system protein VasJ
MLTSDKSEGFEYWEEVLTEESPCGDDLSLDPEFERLREEIGKDTSLHGDQKTDWLAVYELVNSLLTRSKDIWFFAYGTIAVYHIKNLAECTKCIHSLSSMLSSQWSHLHPSSKRPKRREAPLKWLCDKFHHLSASTAFIDVNPNDITILNAAFTGLQDQLDVLLPDNKLTFRSILRAKLENSQGIGQPKNMVAANPAAHGASQNAPPLRSALEAIEKRSNIPAVALPQVIRAVNDNSRQLGDHLLGLNKEDERAYQLHRIALWGTLLQLPPSEANGLTQLSCPIPSEAISMYTNAVHEKRYAEILPQIERATNTVPYWLDGQYLIVLCLEGISATAVAVSVKHSLAQLIHRFPDVLSLKFKDGKPFASPKTVAWINSFVSTIFGNDPYAASGQPVISDAAQEEEHNKFQEAMALSAKGDFKAGLELLGGSPPGKSRSFMRQSVLKAKYCIAAGQLQAATHLLKTMLDKLKAWDLLDWEPELSAEVISLLLSLRSEQSGPDDKLQALLHFISLETAVGK